MANTIFNILGTQLHEARVRRRLSQPQLAMRVGRDRARISELERDLSGDRSGRDRLTLFAEICDALDLVPVLVPRSRALEVRALVSETDKEERRAQPGRTAFDELFVDLGAEDEGER